MVSSATRSWRSARREELGVLRGTGVGDDQPQPRVAREQGGHRSGTGVLRGDRAAAGVQHDRGAGLGDQAPRLVQQRVGDVEAADLDVHLEHLDVGQAGRDVRLDGPSSGKNVPQTAASGTRAAKPAAQSLSQSAIPGRCA